MKPLLADQTLFRAVEAFDPDYVPEQFSHRSEQLHALSGCIKPALKGGRPVNALLIGNPATGKSTSIKLTFQQLEEFTKKVVPVYVNCAILQSQFRIFSEIHKKVLGFLPPETGSPLTKIYDSIFEKLSREKKSLLVALDDFGTEHADTLYSILRAYEMYSVKTAVFAVLHKNELHRLDDKTRSIFNPQEVIFHPYTTAQVLDILKSRAAAGLYPGVAPTSVLEEIAIAASERNDLRYGIEILKRAALEAENDGLRMIKDAHVRKALGNVKGDENEPDDKMLLRLIGNNPNINSGKLFELFKKGKDVSYSTFYRLLRKLEDDEKIKTKTVGNGGRTRIISRN